MAGKWRGKEKRIKTMELDKVIDIDETIKQLRKMQHHAIKESELYSDAPYYDITGSVVYPEPEDYFLKDAINALKQLKKYENLENSGRLLKLPCNIGDTIYAVDPRKEGIDILELEVTRIEINEFKNIQYYAEEKGTGKWFLLRDNHFDKRVFLTRKEAEVMKEIIENNCKEVGYDLEK